MGNSTNSNMQVLQPLGQQWITYREQSSCTILKNIQTSKHLEQYVVNTLKSTSQELDIYEYRYHQRANLVSTISVQKKSSMFCNNNAQLIVTNQRIPKRLWELKNLILQQSISILYSTLIGYKTIFDKTGYCEITNKMIGFNEDNMTKVWINQNFGKNYSQNQYEDSKSSSNILQMVTTILKIICQHSTSYFNEISIYVQKAVISNQTFQEALTSVQTYIKTKFIKLPHKLTLEACKSNKKLNNPPSTIVQTQTTSRSKNVSVSNFQICGLKTNNQSIFTNVLRQPDTCQQYFNQKNNIFSPTKMLNKTKSDSNLCQILSPRHYSKPKQIRQSYLINNFKPLIKANISTNSQMMMKSPSFSSLNNIKTSHKQQHISISNKITQTNPIQFNSQNSIHRSPYDRLKTIESSNASVSMTNSKFESPVFKLIPRTVKPSQFSNQKQSDPFQQICISQIKQIPLQDKSNISSLQTTGQFKQLQIIQDLSEQVSSHRIRPFIPPLHLNQNQEQIDNQMIQSLRNDLYLNQFQRTSDIEHEQQMKNVMKYQCNKILTTVQQQEQTSRRSARIVTLNKIYDQQNMINFKDDKVNNQNRGLFNLSPINNLILNSYKSPFKENSNIVSKNTALYL